MARLMKLPRATQASAALAAETGGVGLEAVGAVKGVQVLQGGVAITVDGAATGAVVVSMAAHGDSANGREQPEGSQPEYKVEQHGKMPSPRPGQHSHHGVMSAWMKKHFPGYDPNKAPAILMPEEAHRATFGIYNEWRTMVTRRMGGRFDFSRVSEAEMRALSEKMFDAARVPAGVRHEYWTRFERMMMELRGRR